MKYSHSSVSAPLGKDWYQNREAPARVWGTDREADVGPLTPPSDP